MKRHELAEAKAAEGQAELTEYGRLKEEVKRLEPGLHLGEHDVGRGRPVSRRLRERPHGFGFGEHTPVGMLLVELLDLTSKTFFLLAEYRDPHVRKFLSLIQIFGDLQFPGLDQQRPYRLIDHTVIRRLLELAQSLIHLKKLE